VGGRCWVPSCGVGHGSWPTYPPRRTLTRARGALTCEGTLPFAPLAVCERPSDVPYTSNAGFSEEPCHTPGDRVPTGKIYDMEVRFSMKVNYRLAEEDDLYQIHTALVDSLSQFASQRALPLVDMDFEENLPLWRHLLGAGGRASS
jgi:hypothetical protein